MRTIFTKVITVILLLGMSSCSSANCIENNWHQYLSDKFSVEISVAEVVTFEQAEKKSLERLARVTNVPKVPFGRLNEQWENLKRKSNVGDKLIYFNSSDKSWAALYGREGYILIRCSEAVDMLIIRMS